MQETAGRSSLRALCDRGERTLGGWLGIPSGFSAELMATYGFDWVCVDTQHGVIGYDQMVAMLQAVSGTGTPALVRVGPGSPTEIMRALDAGAAGVVVPMVNSAEEARAAVAACRYPPEGGRSWGPARASLHKPVFTPDSANRDVVCLVMVETPQGLDRLDDIVATPGVDGIFVGPMDLAVGLGLPPSFANDDERHRQAIERIGLTCRKHGIVAGIACGDPDTVRRWSEVGYTMFALASDAIMLRESAHRWLADLNGSGTPSTTRTGGYT